MQSKFNDAAACFEEEGLDPEHVQDMLVDYMTPHMLGQLSLAHDHLAIIKRLEEHREESLRIIAELTWSAEKLGAKLYGLGLVKEAVEAATEHMTDFLAATESFSVDEFERITGVEVDRTSEVELELVERVYEVT